MEEVYHSTTPDWIRVKFYFMFCLYILLFIHALYLFYSLCLFLYRLFILVVYCDLILSFFLCLDPIEI